jgi:diaminohydroxyphosphoribosylaminopyrimidine deaminase/5-amino-6-(5-phosphoribosylamino)uracil reductase
LWDTASQVPVLVFVGENYPASDVATLEARGVEVLRADVGEAWAEMGQRRWTNVLVEGGAGLLGQLFDAGLVDEAHAFLAPLVIGGRGAPGPVAGNGVPRLAEGLRLVDPLMVRLGDDVALRGRVGRRSD